LRARRGASQSCAVEDVLVRIEVGDGRAHALRPADLEVDVRDGLLRALAAGEIDPASAEGIAANEYAAE
jgi:hypothetical protein